MQFLEIFLQILTPFFKLKWMKLRIRWRGLQFLEIFKGFCSIYQVEINEIEEKWLHLRRGSPRKDHGMCICRPVAKDRLISFTMVMDVGWWRSNFVNSGGKWRNNGQVLHLPLLQQRLLRFLSRRWMRHNFDFWLFDDWRILEGFFWVLSSPLLS